MGEAVILCSPVLRVRAGCSAEPEYALDVSGADARHRVRAGVWLHLEGREADAAEVLIENEFICDKKVGLATDRMNNRQEMRNRVEQLLEELAAIEQQMNDTQSHSDQQLLDQAWEDLSNQIALLQEAIEMDYEYGLENEDVEEEQEDEEDWGGEEYPISTTVYWLGDNLYITQEELDRYNNMRDDREYYETDYGVYYNAADEI